MTRLLHADDQAEVTTTRMLQFWDNAPSKPIYTTLQPKQNQFLAMITKYSLMWGAKWWGKSHAFRARAARDTLKAPNLKGLVLRRTFSEVENNFLTPFRQEVPKEYYDYNVSKHILTFPNWSTIELWYCQNENDIFRYQGIEYDWIGIEELTQRKYEWFMLLMTSMRTGKAWYNPNFFWSANPWGIGHARVKRLFIDRQYTPEENPDLYGFLSAKIYDNKVLMQNDPWYLQTLMALDDKRRKAYLDGNRDIFSGQYFSMFDKHIHVIPPQIPMNVKRRIRVLDYWYTNPSGVLWIAETTQGDYIVYRELYKTGLTYRNLGVHIKALTSEQEKFDWFGWDPAAVNKKSESDETSLAQEFAKLWLYIESANNERVAWWNKIRDLLTPQEDPNNPWQKKPRLFICENCENLIRTLPTLIHAKTNVEDVDTTGEDHLPDALRYWLAELCEINTSLTDVAHINQSMQQKSSIDKLENTRSDNKNELWNFLDTQF